MDIVYAIKADHENEELRYSLRSIAKHVPHGKVFISGFMPDFVNPKTVIHIDSYAAALPFDPRGSKHRTGYQDAEANWIAACIDERVSDDFILFNDDFFVMKPVTGIPAMHEGDVDEAIARRIKVFGKGSFTRALTNTRDFLAAQGITECKSYALHVPMVLNKQKRLRVAEMQSDSLKTGTVMLARTIYGNLFGIGGDTIDDVKVAGWITEVPEDVTFLSSNDKSFKNGQIGQYIREQFPERCKYEKHH